MENPLPAQGGGLGVSSQGAEGLNNKFKIVKQLQAASNPSLKNLAPETKSIKEMGASFDMGTKIGMTNVYSETGMQFPATVIEAGPCYICSINYTP